MFTREAFQVSSSPLWPFRGTLSRSLQEGYDVLTSPLLFSLPGFASSSRLVVLSSLFFFGIATLPRVPTRLFSLPPHTSSAHLWSLCSPQLATSHPVLATPVQMSAMPTPSDSPVVTRPSTPGFDMSSEDDHIIEIDVESVLFDVSFSAVGKRPDESCADSPTSLLASLQMDGTLINSSPAVVVAWKLFAETYPLDLEDILACKRWPTRSCTCFPLPVD